MSSPQPSWARVAANAACSPSASGEAPAALAEPSAATVTNSAVPSAPATCCSVDRIALPWEYSSSGSEPSAYSSA